MIGCTPYGCVLYGGLFTTYDTTFPLSLALYESSIYTLALIEHNNYSISLSES